VVVVLVLVLVVDDVIVGENLACVLPPHELVLIDVSPAVEQTGVAWRSDD
jgi:hypothetical protein